MLITSNQSAQSAKKPFQKIKFLTYTGKPSNPTQEGKTDYTPALYERAKQDLQAFQELAIEIGLSESIKLIKSDDQSVHLGEITKKAVNQSRRALFEIYKAVANDPAFSDPVNSIIKRYIKFNERLQKTLTVSFGEKNGQFEIPNINAYNELSEPAKALIKATILMREMRGLTELSRADSRGLIPSWDSVLVHDRLLRGENEIYDSYFNSLKQLQDRGFPAFAANFARSIAYSPHDPIANFFIELSDAIMGTNAHLQLSQDEVTVPNQWNWEQLQKLSTHFNSTASGFGLTAQQNEIFPTILLLDSEQKDFLLRPRTRSEIAGEGIPSTIVLDGLELPERSKKEIFGSKNQNGKSGNGSTGNTNSTTARLHSGIQSIFIHNQTETEKQELPIITNVLNSLPQSNPSIRAIHTLITALIQSGNYERAITELTKSTTQFPEFKTHFTSIEQSLRRIVEANRKEAATQIIPLTEASSNRRNISAKKTTEAIAGKVLDLNSIPGIEKYNEFWGGFSIGDLESFVALCENKDSGVSISVNKALFRRLLTTGIQGSDSLPENHLEVFIGNPDSISEIHKQNRDNLVNLINEIIAERLARAAEKLRKEQEKELAKSKKAVSSSTIGGQKKKERKNNSIKGEPQPITPPTEVLTEKIEKTENADLSINNPINQVIHPAFHLKLINENPLAALKTNLFDENFFHEDKLKELAHQELNSHLETTQLLINPLTDDFTNFLKYYKSAEYPAINELSQSIQIPKLANGTTSLDEEEYTAEGIELNVLEKQGLAYLNQIKAAASELEIDWDITDIQGLKPDEELDKLRAWSASAGSKSGNNYNSDQQKAFLQLLINRLIPHKPYMELSDISYGLLSIKGKNIDYLSEDSFKELRKRFPDLKSIVSDNTDLNLPEFKTLALGLTQVLDYQITVQKLKAFVPIIHAQFLKKRNMDQLPSELKTELTSLLNKFEKLPIPEKICQSILQNTPFHDLLALTNDLIAVIKNQRESSLFIAPYTMIPLGEETEGDNGLKGLRNLGSQKKIIEINELESSHPFTEEQLTFLLREREKEFASRGKERVYRTRTPQTPSLIELQDEENDTITLDIGTGRAKILNINNLLINEEYDRVLAIAKRALEDNPMSPTFISHYAIALFGLDKNIEAIQFLDQKIPHLAKDAQRNFLQIKALCYLAIHSENKAEEKYFALAVKSYKQALDLDENAHSARAALTLLGFSKPDFNPSLYEEVTKPLRQKYTENIEEYSLVLRSLISQLRRFGLLSQEPSIKIQIDIPNDPEPFFITYEDPQ